MYKEISKALVPVRRLSRSGFTLVELLVVIGIIAILAGVALGPITNGLKKAKQSGGAQTARTLALAEFQYANDNNSVYPDLHTPNAGTGGGAGTVASALMAGSYITDPAIFYINGAANESKWTSNTFTAIPPANVSWDFMGATSGAGVTFDAPDTLPLVWSSVGSAFSSTPAITTTGPTVVTLGSTMPFQTQGVAVCYKSNSASFIVASGGTVQLTTGAYVGYPSAVVNSGGG